MERVQNACFERWPGQQVWRHQTPIFSNCSEQQLGWCRGTVLAIGVYKQSTNLLRIAWDSQIKLRWNDQHRVYTPEVLYGDAIPDWQRVGSVFDWGTTTCCEFDILARGGLLSSTGRYFDEAQDQNFADNYVRRVKKLLKALEKDPDLVYWRADEWHITKQLQTPQKELIEN